MTKAERTKPDPKRGVARHPDTGQIGGASAFFSVEHGDYSVVVLWRSRGKAERKDTERTFAKEFKAPSVRGLAARMRDAGWTPPRGLRRLCESAPRSTFQ